jgi:DNA-binding transcriptional LysR family regulator
MHAEASKSMRMDIHHIKAFLAVVDVGQFRGAAERLHITQPALSRIVKALEEDVDAILLRRTTRVVELTEAGRVFAEQSRLAIAHLERAVTLARRAQAGQIGNLRIAYMDFAINGSLPQVIEEFSKLYPEIGIDLVHIPSTQQKAAILDSTIDIGFLIGPFVETDVETRTFATEKLVALLPEKHALARKKTLRLTDLAEESFVLGAHETWEAFRHHVFAVCHRAGFIPRIDQEASTSDGIFGLVAANTGVSVYPACARNIQRRGLAIRPLRDVDVSLDIVVSWRADYVNPSTGTFAQFLDKNLLLAPASPP